jgi:putative superfamily III holin-X
VSARTGPDKSKASTADLVKDLSREVSTLVRDEVALAKAEIAQKGREAAAGMGMLLGALVVGLAVVGGTMAFLILILDGWMPSWLATLVVTAAYAAVAGTLAVRGKRLLSKASPPAPERTIESVKEDVRWAKSHATSKHG